MLPPVQKFPMDGFADTCTGFGRPLHGTNEELGTGNDALCADCKQRLLDTIKDESCGGATYQHSRGLICPSGCKDHTHGSRYYDCLCCYGD